MLNEDKTGHVHEKPPVGSTERHRCQLSLGQGVGPEQTFSGPKGAAMGAGDDIIIPGNAQLVSKGCRDSIDHLSRGDNLFLELKKENSKQMGMKSCL